MKLLACVLAAVVGGVTWGQEATVAQKEGVPPNDGFGIIHLQTRLGSFKIIDGQGRAEFDFKGTILVNKIEGRLSVTGAVRKEYEKHDRQIWTGSGRVVILGKWRGLQWFGKDLKGYWYGGGMIRLSGEFDREQRTGEYWYEDPGKIFYWPGGSTIDVPVPEVRVGLNKKAKVKKKVGG